MSTDNAVVLIVEDERELTDLYARWLSDEYQVRTAYDAEQALELLDETVNVVLLDRRMPGQSGDETLDRILDRGLDCRVAMVTAVEPDFDIIELGFDDYVEKPVTKADLRDVVEKLLTRTTYDQTLREYYALVATRAALQTEKPATELADNGRYTELTIRIQEYEATLDRSQADLDPEGYEAAFRDLAGVRDDE